MNHTMGKKSFRSILLPIAFITLSCISTTQADPPWVQVHKMFAPDGADRDQLGTSIAINGKTVVCGAPYADNDVPGTDSGSAYVFNAKTGKVIYKLLASDGLPGDVFGKSVAVYGNLAVIGASKSGGVDADPGAAYVFDLTTGKQLLKLIAPDGHNNDQFGTAVAIYKSVAVVGAQLGDGKVSKSGAAYVFDLTTGKQLFKLIASDGTLSDWFGNSVSIDGNLVVIGAMQQSRDAGFPFGAAYVFDLTTGQQLFKLISSDGGYDDKFGSSVAISGYLAVIGAFQDQDNGHLSGSAYIFDVTNGKQLFKLLPTNGYQNNRFGNSVSASGNTAIIGAYIRDNSIGTAYVFDITTGRQLYQLFAIGATSGDDFGFSVSLCGDIAAIGAIGSKGTTNDSGAAYIFKPLNIDDQLTVSPDPLIADQDGTFSVFQALPNMETWLLYSVKGLQQSFIRQLNVSIDLKNPMIAEGPQTTNAKGALQFVIPIPMTQNITDIWFQVAQHRNTTNFVATQILP